MNKPAELSEYDTISLIMLMRGLEKGTVSVDGLPVTVTREDVIKAIKEELNRRGSRPL